ncbi:MAG: 6-phosphogluconolactonase [Thermodesulfobacteriota bacterium]|nr:6-phosphogluconolactonase [Thermodesulfobacteriota bacterium]
MAFKVIICKDFDHMSEVAGSIAVGNIKETISKKGGFVLGLATGNSPTGLYKHLAKSANAGEFDPAKIKSFNLDEYIGLPGENAQQRALHPESYSYFMIREFFSLLHKSFIETNVPWGTLIDQEELISELNNNPDDWKEQGTDKGKAIVIKEDAASDYLRWIRKETVDAYVEKINNAGGIDLHIIGVGGRGHVAFHESGIPFDDNEMLLVKLDENTVANAVEDGHFLTKQDSPRYALSMGAEQVYKAGTVLLLANGPRKSAPVAESLLKDPTPDIPISYSQIYSENVGNMIYVIDKAAAKDILTNIEKIQDKGIEIEDISDQSCRVRVEDLKFFRDPDTCLMG